MVGQFSRQQQLDAGQDLLEAQGALLGVSDQLGGQHGDLVKGVVDHGVHDVHGLLADSLGWVNLSQDFVDVDAESFVSLLLSTACLDRLHLLDGLVALAGLTDSFLGWHSSFNYKLACFGN